MRKTAAILAFLGLVLSSAALPCFATALAAEREQAAPMADCEGATPASQAALCAEPGFAAPLAGAPHDLPGPPLIVVVPAALPPLAPPGTPQGRFLTGDLSPPRAAPAFLLHSALLI